MTSVQVTLLEARTVRRQCHLVVCGDLTPYLHLTTTGGMLKCNGYSLPIFVCIDTHLDTHTHTLTHTG